MSLQTGYCPKDWKLAQVSPAYKGKGNISEETNYRPLSVISHLAKICEKSVQNQLLQYLMSNKFISIDQFAYLKLHSTQMCLHRLIDDILDNVNQKEKTALCFLDIRKCFDTINHDILLHKLKKYGIKDLELKWFASYLSERSQIVVHNGAKSDTAFLNIGVPQGTILGPILFLIYVNDLSNVVRDGFINIFADDVVVYSSSSCIQTLQASMQNTMNDVFKWYQDNKLCLSIDKCSTLVINNNIKNPIRDFKINIGNEPLLQVKSMKYLGVVIDDTLNWHEHISTITKKFNIINARLRKLRNTTPLELRVKLYNSICTPVLDYASTVWGSFAQNVTNKIQRMEHIAARTLSGNYDFINVRGSTLMTQLNMSSFQNRYKYFLSLLTYKAIHGLVPDHIANNIIFSYEVSQRHLRSFNNMHLYKPKPTCELFKKSFAFAGPSQWNILPLQLKESSSVGTFKHLYKTIYPLCHKDEL